MKKKAIGIIVIFIISIACIGLFFLTAPYIARFSTTTTAVDLKTHPKVTVLMSTFNRADYLPGAIDSILNQTFKDFEFIIVNDGSTDNTDAVLNAYARKDNRIKILKSKTNKGLVDSLNQGLDFAKGKYIARMDDDDLSLPYRLEAQTRYLDTHPDITVLGSAYITRENKILRMGGPATPETAKIISYIRVPVLHPTTMIRRDFLNKHGIRYNNKYPSSEDTDFFHQIAVKDGKILNLGNPLLIYSVKSLKTSGYHAEQADSHNRFVIDTLAPYMNADKLKPDAGGFCYILTQLEQAAWQNRIDIDMPALRTLISNRGCRNNVDEN